MEYYIYYRGQNINQVRAANPDAALAKHYEMYTKGTKGTEIAVSVESEMSAFAWALEASKTI